MNPECTYSSNINFDLLNSLVAETHIYGGDLIGSLRFKMNDIKELFEHATEHLANNEPLPKCVLELLPQYIEYYQLLTGQLPIELMELLTVNGHYGLLIEILCKLNKCEAPNS